MRPTGRSDQEKASHWHEDETHPLDVAISCGDEATAEVARINRADEEEMSKKISAMWGEAIDLTLEQEGIAA